MKSYVKKYLKASGKDEGEEILCEVCGAVATDIHHIQRRGMGGSKTADRPENLMALCRKCHEDLGDRKQHKDELKRIHAETAGRWGIEDGY